MFGFVGVLGFYERFSLLQLRPVSEDYVVWEQQAFLKLLVLWWAGFELFHYVRATANPELYPLLSMKHFLVYTALWIKSVGFV